MIGLIDYDLQTSTSTNMLIPNIEIMKLATYYKIEENQFCRLIDLNETELSSYDKIYFFSEQEIQPKVPAQFLRVNNVIFGGTAFTNGIYKPFENEIIDYTIPRPTIYKEFLKEKYNEGVKTKVIAHTLDDTYYRNYAGKNKLPIPPVLPKKRIILYDKDFFYSDWEQTMKIFAERKCSSIYRIHPIICHTLTEFFKARSCEKLNRANDFIFDIEIPLQDIYYMLKKYKKYFLADITKNASVYIPIGGTLQTNLQYSRDIVYKLNLLYSFWAQDINMKTKYIPPKFGTINPYEEIYQIIEKWSNVGINRKHPYSIIDKIPKNKKFNYLREQIEQLIKYQPSIKDLFNQTYEGIKERKVWQL